jgi:hypothetical protein
VAARDDVRALRLCGAGIPDPREEKMRELRSIVSGVFVLTLVSAGFTARAQTPPPAPAPGAEHKKLGYFVGTWTTEGEMKANPFAPAGKYTSTDHCKWFDGNFAVVCDSQGKGPKGPTKGLGILGYSAEESVYTYYGVDNSGMISTTVPRGTVEGDTWTYTDESKMGGKTIKSRYVINVLSPTSYAFKWEAEEDGKWNTVFDGKTSKKSAGAKPAAAKPAPK